MATILPGSPPVYNKENVSGTVRAICSYLRTTHDNLDFQLVQIKKRLDAHDESISALEKRASKLEKRASDLEKKVSDLNAGLKDAQKDIGKLKTDYIALNARVTALEQENTTGGQ